MPAFSAHDTLYRWIETSAAVVRFAYLGDEAMILRAMAQLNNIAQGWVLSAKLRELTTEDKQLPQRAEG